MSSTPAGRRRRPQEIKLPDGKKVIVALPENLEALRQKYASEHHGHQLQVEIVVHGSDEHTGFLQQSRDHHETRRSRLRQQHGSAFDEWEDVQTQLDSVTAELDSLANHASHLSANFSKFGYDAKLRTYDGSDRSPVASTRTLLNEAASMSSKEERVRLGETTKLFKKPVVKQWFHKGLLWRASDNTEIMAVELFFDLLYVAIIHVNGEHLAEDPTGFELLRFAITFVMSWKIWADVTQVLSWFETDDVVSRFEMLFEIACLLGFTTNMTYSFYEDDHHNTYTQLVGFYLAARMKNAVHLFFTGQLLPMIKGIMVAHVILIIIPSAIWVGSIYVGMPTRLGLIIPALFLDVYGTSLIVILFSYTRSRPGIKKPASQVLNLFEFFPAINIEHKVERTNAFVSLVLGYSIVGVIFQSYGGYTFNAFLGKAILGMVQAFFFNWIYFDIDAFGTNLHAIRRSWVTASLWQNAHLPFIMGYIVASAGLSKLVLIADVPDTNPEQLSSHYSPLVEEHIPTGIRFFYCHGLAVALLFMAAISLSHDHSTSAELRLSKTIRLANRLAVSLALFLLPLADSLNSLHLISVTLGLTSWVLLIELWGNSSRRDPFVGERKGCCVRYSAACAKRDLEQIAPEGEKVEKLSVEIVALDEKDKTAVEAQD